MMDNIPSGVRVDSSDQDAAREPSNPFLSGPTENLPRPTVHHEHSSHLSKFGATSHIVYHDSSVEERPTSLRKLVRALTIRQWFENGKLHREPSVREVPRFELFFDLLFVGVIHQLAEAAIEEPSGPAVARFVLTFWPSWSMWDEARKYSNVSGTDDLLHRTWVLAGMICILGYTVNASSIALEVDPDGEGFEHQAVQAAAAFWLVIKLTRVLVLLYYGYRLPLFRPSQILMAVASFIPMCFYLPLIWVEDRHTQIILASIAIPFDIFRIDLLFYNVYGRLRIRKISRTWDESSGGERPSAKLGKMPSLPEGFRIPAMNIEHAIERIGAFVVIVLGELVMNLLYTATAADVGLSLIFGKAALGLMVAWALNYLYMLPQEPLNEYEHALRRSWFSGVCFTFFHWPLCAALVLASAASGKMVLSEEVDAGVHWYWGCGLGFTVLFMTLIDLCHRNMASLKDARVPRPIRTVLGILAALALILFPLGASELSSVANLAIAVAIIWFLLVVNIIGMLPRLSR